MASTGDHWQRVSGGAGNPCLFSDRTSRRCFYRITLYPYEEGLVDGDILLPISQRGICHGVKELIKAWA